jgi:hypothetical protein
LAGAAIVDIMSSPQEPYVDPSGNTEAFKAFVNRGGQSAEPPVAPKKSAMPLAIGSAVAVVIIAIVVWLVAK